MLALGGTSGCGPASPELGLSAAEQSRLLERIEAARAAIRVRNPVGARRSLRALNRDVERLGRQGKVNEARVERLRLGIARAQRLVGVEVPPPAALPAQPTAPHGHGKAKGAGKRKGRKRD